MRYGRKKAVNIEIITRYPPNIRDIEAVLTPNKDTVYTYFPNVYIPSGKKPEQHLLLHEEIHIRQQEQMGPEKWWAKYLSNQEFRLSQELPAFAVQYAFLKTYLPPKQLAKAITDFSLTLSGPQYKLGLPYHKVERMIKDKAKEYETA